MNTDVKKFWDQQAVKFGSSDEATAPDRYYRELEIEHICDWIKGPSILDIGCGNGYSTQLFAQHNVNFQFLGLDYSEEMIARAVPGHNHTYRVGNVLSLPDQKFDTIISERCIINLADWDEQREALLQMRDHLNPDGQIVLVENFTKGLESLNNLRRVFELPKIEQRWHNCYINDYEFSKFIEIEDKFIVHYEENIGNLYYIISRVVYAAMAKERGEEILYDHPLNKIAAQLPSFGEKFFFSPNWLYVLRTK